MLRSKRRSSPRACSVVAGIVVFVFGALGAWLMTARYPHAHFMRAGYVCMALGGIFFIVWTLKQSQPIGIAGAALLGVGGLLGVVGAFRRELRVTL